MLLTEADPRGGGGAVGARPPLKSVNLFFFAAWHAVTSARSSFDQRTAYVLSTARVMRSVSSQSHAVSMA